MTNDATCIAPAGEASGLSDAHFDTLQMLVEEVLNKVANPSATMQAKALRLLGRAPGVIVAKLAARGVYLPSLATEGQVTTSPDADAVDLPADWHGNLHGAYEPESGKPVHAKSWTALQRERHVCPVRAGHIIGVAVYGRQLRYWRVPDIAVTLMLRYHRLPAPLVLPSCKPFDIPVELSTDLLVKYACAEAYADLEQDQGTPKTTTLDYRTQFEQQLDILAREIGPWPKKADEIVDAMGWRGMW